MMEHQILGLRSGNIVITIIPDLSNFEKLSQKTMFPGLSTFGKHGRETMFPGLSTFGKHG